MSVDGRIMVNRGEVQLASRISHPHPQRLVRAVSVYIQRPSSPFLVTPLRPPADTPSRTRPAARSEAGGC
jgi:hypothetical protein